MNAQQKTPLKLDRSVPFVDAVFRIIEGAGTQLEAVNALREAENVCGIELTTKPPIQSVQEVMVERYSELIEPRMQRFLSETHLVIGSAESSRLHVLALGGYTYKWTHREWAQMLASWANQSKWLGVEIWNYLDFYGGPNDRLIENYNAWCETAMSVVETKSSQTSRD